MKDLDVWTFYAAIPGSRFPADKPVRRPILGRHPWDGKPTTCRRPAVSVSRPCGSAGPPTRAEELTFASGHRLSKLTHPSTLWSSPSKGGWHAVRGALPLANRPHGISRRKLSCFLPRLASRLRRLGTQSEPPSARRADSMRQATRSPIPVLCGRQAHGADRRSGSAVPVPGPQPVPPRGTGQRHRSRY